MNEFHTTTVATTITTDVAMVIIVTLVAKIYFPESLERGETGMPQARTFNYRMAEGDYYGSDDDEDYNKKEDDGVVKMRDDDEDDENEILDSDGEASEEEQAPQQDGGAATRRGTNQDNGDNIAETDDLLTEMRPQENERVATASRKHRGVSFGNKDFLEFEQLTMSKTEVLKRLALCTVMLTVTFVAWGVLQVRILVVAVQ